MKILFGFLLCLSPLAALAALHPAFEKTLHLEEQALETLRRLKRPDNQGAAIQCVRVETEIFSIKTSVTLPEAIRLRLGVGFFRRAQKLPALLRFRDLGTAGLRAELAVMTGENSPSPNGRMDFAFQNSPVRFENDVITATAALQLKREGFLKTSLGFGLENLVRAQRLKSEISPATMAYQKTTFYSGLPYRLGAFEAVKYRLQPCDWNPSEKLGSGPEAAARELRRHVQTDSVMSCFDFQVQLLEVETMRTVNGKAMAAREWIENADLLWPESGAPFYDVGRLTVKAQDLIDPLACLDFGFNPERNTTSEHRGLGSLQRAKQYLDSSPPSKAVLTNK